MSDTVSAHASPAYPPVVERRLLTLFVMAAAVMNLLDTTIANVALPHMQGSTSASREEITWVLTSYITAAAIFTPLTGWLAGRFGRKRLLLMSIGGFTVASALCGMAETLPQLILFRILQGVFGSSLVPMGQSTLLDINPPERHGKAMAVFGLGAIMGPLVGPLAGGWLTENLNWRWVFYINLPVGVFSAVGLMVVMKETRTASAARLDFFGFSLLAIGLGMLQLFLDRGQQLDWWSSTEIRAELTLSLLAFAMFAIHSLTARAPFINPAIFRDWNFTIATVVGFSLGVLVYSAMALIPPMMEALLGYPTLAVGWTMAPRGLGTLVAMLTMGRLVGRVDSRILIAAGLLLSAASMWELSHLTLASNESLIVWSGVLQGMGSSSIFVPLMTMAFATLPPRWRDEGAAMSTLIRNMGASVGIAVIQATMIRQGEVVHSRLAEGLRPDNPVLGYAMPGIDWGSASQLGNLNLAVTRQAAMVSYVDSFWALFVVGLASVPMVLLLRAPRRKPRLDRAPVVIVD